MIVLLWFCTTGEIKNHKTLGDRYSGVFSLIFRLYMSSLHPFITSIQTLHHSKYKEQQDDCAVISLFVKITFQSRHCFLICYGTYLIFTVLQMWWKHNQNVKKFLV